MPNNIDPDLLARVRAAGAAGAAGADRAAGAAGAAGQGDAHERIDFKAGDITKLINNVAKKGAVEAAGAVENPKAMHFSPTFL